MSLFKSRSQLPGHRGPTIAIQPKGDGWQWYEHPNGTKHTIATRSEAYTAALAERDGERIVWLGEKGEFIAEMHQLDRKHLG